MNEATTAKSGLTLNRRTLAWVDALSLRFGVRTGIAPHLATGLKGEEEALFFLMAHGYVVVARRWKTPKLLGDVDLIAWDRDTLCFIEVKTRMRRDIVPAEFAVDQRKQKMLRSMASVFRKHLPEETRRQTQVRFDVVSVYLGDAGKSLAEIELFPTAFASHSGQ